MSSSYRRGYRDGGRWHAAPLVAVALCFLSGGCSLGVGPMSDERVEATGSIRKSVGSPLSNELGQEDWRRAKAAMAVALDPQGSGSPVKWENPDSEVSGTFTPVAQPFVKGDEVCRAFLASITFPDRSSQLQGTACRLSAGEWQLGEVKPWRKPT